MELEIGERSNEESGGGNGGLEATGGMRDGGMDGVRKEIGGDPMVEVMESAGVSDKESGKEGGFKATLRGLLAMVKGKIMVRNVETGGMSVREGGEQVDYGEEAVEMEEYLLEGERGVWRRRQRWAWPRLRKWRKG